MTGISYNGKKADGSNDWSGVSNVKLLKFETAYSFEVIKCLIILDPLFVYFYNYACIYFCFPYHNTF